MLYQDETVYFFIVTIIFIVKFFFFFCFLPISCSFNLNQCILYTTIVKVKEEAVLNLVAIIIF